MRIIGQLEHPRIKITLFDQNDKLTAKFEKGQSEIILKFREDKSEVMDALHQENDYTAFSMIEKQLDSLLIFKQKFETGPTMDPELPRII